MINNCHLCQKLSQDNHLFVHEFEHAVWYLGDNQYYRGYSILVSKHHFREWHELPESIAQSMNDNLRKIAAIIEATCQPFKMNLASFGNVVEHLHWHIIPRYLTDPNRFKAPDLSGEHLPQQSITKDQLDNLIKTFKHTIAPL